MNRGTGLSWWYAKEKQGGCGYEAKGHPERAVHELCEESNPHKCDEFKGHD